MIEESNRKLAREVSNNKFKNAQEKLISKYKAFIYVEIIMIFYIIFFIGLNPLVADRYRLVNIIYWCCFFMVEIGVDTYLLRRVKLIDIYNSSVSDIAKNAAENWKLHKLALVLGLPLAFGAIILVALAFQAHYYTILGMIAGGLIGCIIGLFQLNKFREYYRLLQSDEKWN